MKKKDLEKRILELELLLKQKDDFIQQLLNELDNKKPQVIPYFGGNDDICTDGQPHEYPFPWHSITPAPCKKCGKPAKVYDVTFTTNDTGNPPWDFRKHGGNVIDNTNPMIEIDNSPKNFGNYSY